MFSFSFMQLLKLTSVLVNAVFLGISLKRRVVMDDYLTGKWVGDLAHLGPNGSHYDVVTNCVMMLSRHKEGSNSGYIYYESVNPSRDRVIYRGLDKLNQYQSDPWFFITRKWNPRFTCVFHKHDDNVDTTKTVYEFTCEATDFIFKQRMNVKIKLNEQCVLDGCFERVA